ncbi:hypothetical protein [Nocardioides houyundeii]|uniref:hypothetical protein n=1 Tax=Nocardioides houyundeii TaxID=2045452 RepID=UPI000C780926|nr:hypothetical protein [Nocardioides houyundeii]
MSGRGLAATGLLLCLGAGAGYAASYAADPVRASGRAVPVPAAAPSVPTAAGEEITPDPDAAPLPTGLALEETSFGEGPTRVTFPVPAAWVRISNAPNEFKWKVRGNPNDTFVLRVEHVGSQQAGVAEHRAARLASVREQERGVRSTSLGADGLEYTYIDDLGHQRHNFVRWVDLGDGPDAEVEVNVSGRARDAAGAEELLDRVAAGLRQG